MKKFLFFMAVVLSLGLTARAANGDIFDLNGFRYQVLSETQHTVSLSSRIGSTQTSGDVVIPANVENKGVSYTVTQLGDFLFLLCSDLTSVTIPNTVTRIGKSAFSSCRGLTSMTIPNSVTYIGDSAFDGCSGLTSITIPESVTSIRTSVFSGCYKLTSVTIPNSVKSIGSYAFNKCSGLTSVTIPNSVTSIGGAAFSNCTSLQEIVLEEGNPNYTAIDGVVYNSMLTQLIIYPAGKKGAFEIPNTVTEIGESAFYGCTGLTSVSIPNSVTSIGKSAFDDCTGLTSVSIPNSVASIASRAFYHCESLTSVTIPNSVTSIGESTFTNCGGLTSVTIPNSVTSIGFAAFSNCYNLTSVTIPNSVTEIQSSAFSSCTRLASVIIPNSVTEIGNTAFDGCGSLSTIFALPTTPPSRGSNVFRDVPETAVVYISKGSLNAYSEAAIWNRFTDFREMGAFDIALSESNITIEEGNTATLTATVTKDDEVAVESESWTSSDPEVATVDNDGLVTAVGEGTATITFTVVDSYGCPHSEYCKVTVSATSGIEGIEADGNDAPAEFFNLNGVRVNGDALNPGLYIKRQGGKISKVLVK